MYNRYDGNTGRYVRMPEPERPEPSALRRPPPAQRPREEPRSADTGRSAHSLERFYSRQESLALLARFSPADS